MINRLSLRTVHPTRLTNVSRRLRRRVVARARPIFRGGNGETAQDAHVPTKIVRAKDPLKEARRKATKLWVAGRRNDSLDVLRSALLKDGGNAVTWHLYGSRMLQERRPDVALEAMKNALELDPGHLRALEVLQGLAATSPKAPAGLARKWTNEMVRSLPDRPKIHRDALAFLIPSRHETGLATLEASSDPVVKLALRLNEVPRHEWSELILDVDERTATLSQIHVLLARGGASQAADLLTTLSDDQLPVFSMRLAIRRNLRADQPGRAQALLRQYRRVRPDDSWAKAKYAETEISDETSRRLLAQGFPVGPAGASPAIDPVHEKFFYGLHNSLPYHSAGYATRTHGLLRSLSERGWDANGVTRLGYPYDMPGHADLGEISDHDEVDGISYYRLSTQPGIERKVPLEDYVSRYATALEPLVRRERPFLLHAASNHWNGLAMVSAARKLGLPSVYEVRGLWEVTRASRDPFWGEGQKYQLIARMETDAAQCATRTIAITGALRDELISRGVDEEKIILVPNGVDTDRFMPRPRNEAMVQELGVEDKVVIGYVGSILDYEGLGLLVDAASMLSGQRSDFVVLIVGDGAEREKLEKRVGIEGLGDIVRFLGRVPHEKVEDYYSIMDVCPLPRLPLPVCEMVSPLKPFEAMAMEKVVVASDVAALAEIVTDGQTGLLHQKGSAESLAAQLRVLIEDAALRRRLAVQAREWVVTNRRWDVLSERVSAIYEELGGVPAGRPQSRRANSDGVL